MTGHWPFCDIVTVDCFCSGGDVRKSKSSENQHADGTFDCVETLAPVRRRQRCAIAELRSVLSAISTTSKSPN
jgi:hypothetical protein